MSTAPAPALDMNKLNAFIGQFVADFGASVHTGMVVIGERLGLYKALAAQAMNPAELAAKTQTDERYVREWLSSQAAGGYVSYDDATGKFSLNAKNRHSRWLMKTAPRICPGPLNWLWARWARCRASPKRFAAGGAWAGTSTRTACSTAAKSFSARATLANLTSVVDSGAGGRAAKARSGRARGGRRLRQRRLHAAHGESVSQIALLRLRLSRQIHRRCAGIGKARRRWPIGSAFDVADAKEFPGKDYDFVAVFDCLHDMGDPVGAARMFSSRSPKTAPG